jgi:golgi phosphoprotein 3
MLTLFEELLLLSIHESKGTFIGSTLERLKVGLGSAVLAELAALGKIQVNQNHRLLLVDDSLTELDILNEVIGAIKESGKERKFGYWVNYLSQKSDKYRKQATEGLVQKGIVTQEENRLPWVIPTPLQENSTASPKYIIVERLRGLVLAGAEPQPRDVILLALVRACGVLDLVFLRDERKFAARAITELSVCEAIKDPVIQTCQEIEAAIADILEED